jgi:hypothetical protein
VRLSFVDQWILKIELNGEWEECCFPTRNEALLAFLALAADYRLQRAILLTSRAAFVQAPLAQHIESSQRLN